jgi:capsular polysaccharide transport system permease protein
MRSLANRILFVLLFILPLLALLVYELRFATDRYHSDASLIINQEEGATPTLDLSAVGLPAASSDKDALVVLRFILSLDMLQYLDREMRLRAHYSEAGIDWWSRLPAAASLEDFHDYMQYYLTAEYNQDSQIISIHVEAFNREFAQRIVNMIVARSQKFVDTLNERITTEQTQFFESQLADSERRLREAKKQLLLFQREHRLLTTEAEAALITSNIGELEKVMLLKQSELEARLKEVNETSPVIQALRGEIDTLKSQIGREKERLSGAAGSAVSELDAQFREIQLNLEFLTTNYKSNLTQLETVRLDAAQRLKFLIVVTQPSIADESLYPDRVYIMGTAALILMMVYFIVSLIVAIIREHT